MDEAKWLGGSTPQAMLRFLRGRGSERKLRLFAVALHREHERLEPRFAGPESRLAVDTAEALAEDSGPVSNAIRYKHGGYFVLNPTGYGAASRLAGISDVPDPFKCVALRCIFGNPFRPVSLDAAWRTPTVLALAQAAYEHRSLPSGHLEPARLAVLADALLDAGCEDPEISAHLRQTGPHVRGCAVVDLILGKS